MPVIGVTGGIGTGKSTVLAILSDLGAVTLSADEAAREVVASGTDGLRRVTEAFGPELIRGDGSLDRVSLANIVFADPAARKRLDEITHPLIIELLRRRIDDARRSNPPRAVIAVEVPLLYEAGMESWFDQVIVVSVPAATQAVRLQARGEMSEGDAHARIDAQMPLAEKEARADFVIANTGDVSSLRRSVEELWPSLAASGNP